ncbi:MAG: enoyl-CoA hydratase-related protein, partial [Paracoccaceae bacterium]
MSEPGAENPVSLRREGDIVIVTIDNPPVNALSHAVRQGLWDVLDLLDADKNIRAVVLICAGRTFVAGADIREFSKPARAPHLPELIKKLEIARVPWLAALHGTALGGGLELALGCRYRIALAGAKLGLPEVTLGLIPGAGGTVRLPRLIGAPAALDMIASGRPVAVDKAMKLGLLDGITQDDLLPAALEFLADMARDGTLIRAASGHVAAPGDDTAWRAQKDAIRAKAKGLNAPIAAINAVENAIGLPGPEALAKEREVFLELKNGLQS